MKDSFQVARGIIWIIEIIGWVVVILSFAVPFIGIIPPWEARVAWMIAFGGAFVGLVLIAIAQIARAQIVTAENTGELIGLIRSQASVLGSASKAAPVAERKQSPRGGEIIKVYKGHKIQSEFDGVSVGTKRFEGVLAAEQWIDLRSPK